jgi:hypothetical protein
VYALKLECVCHGLIEGSGEAQQTAGSRMVER